MSSQQTPSPVKIQCTPNPPLHAIDRRDFLKDGNGNYVLVNGEKQLNWRCACAKLSGNASEYRGGAFIFINTDQEAEDAGVVAP